MTAFPIPLPNRPAGAVSILIDPALRLLGAEPAALALMRSQPGLVSLRQGRLHLPRQQSALEAALAVLQSGTEGHSRGLVLHRPAQAPLTLKLELASGTEPGAVWLHFVDLGAPQLDAQVLATMFGLTGAELRVALMLAQGLSSEDMASRLGVQSNTVRGHIKQLLAKTHTRRQAQLVAWLWRSAAVVHPAHETPAPAPLIPGGALDSILASHPDG